MGDMKTWDWGGQPCLGVGLIPNPSGPIGRGGLDPSSALPCPRDIPSVPPPRGAPHMQDCSSRPWLGSGSLLLGWDGGFGGGYLWGRGPPSCCEWEALHFFASCRGWIEGKPRLQAGLRAHAAGQPGPPEGLRGSGLGRAHGPHRGPFTALRASPRSQGGSRLSFVNVE